MAIEAESIPYEPVALRGERLLVLAPHPDDEVIGCGGLVAQHLREGRKVHVAIATNGAAAGEADLREQESRRGLSLLGEVSALELYRFPDRDLAAHADELLAKLHNTILAFAPDLIAVPSPIEIHPDHLALTRAFCDLVQRDGSLFADAAVARVAFYEVSQPIRPNALVDISGVAARKYDAIAAHASQTAIRDYAAFARGLNAYRAMTLPAGTAFAEGYWLIALPELRTTPFTALQQRAGAAATAIAVKGERAPIAVVIRTKDRPALLREAVDSVRANRYAEEIIVVNDGGARPEIGGVTLIQHETSRGRAEAANAGVRAAGTPFIVFLDDDDLFYPEHLPTLAAAATAAPNRAAWYTDAVSAFLRIGESGAYEAYSRQRLFGGDFDRDLLLVDNDIPLPTVLLHRETFLELGGFDRTFELFEDWDLLIRLAQRGDFLHVPRITCEIRHFEGGSSITLATPEGSGAFRDAKLRVWKKQEALVTPDVFARAFAAQKRRSRALASTLVEEKGRRNHAETDVERLEREKQQLMAELGRVTAVAHEAQAEARKIAPLEELARELRAARAASIADAAAQRAQATTLERAVAEQTTTIGALYAEIHRLQGIVDALYGSRTWKLHRLVQKMKGRG
jgi:LmbE family N-acetylglucosaminyl deacetylase